MVSLRTRFAPGRLFWLQLKNRLTYGPRCLCNLIRRGSTVFAAADIQPRGHLSEHCPGRVLAPRLQPITAKMSRFAFALISVLSHVVAQETRITDPAAAASAENTQFYELIKAEYLAEGCEDAGCARRPSVSDEGRDRPRPLPGVSKRLLRLPLLHPSPAGPSPQPAQRPVPRPFPGGAVADWLTFRPPLSVLCLMF